MTAFRRYPVPAALLIITLVYNVAEGVIAVASGIQASSLTLVAFGFDSYLEVAAAAAVLWRLSYRDEEQGERAERSAMRAIGATFLLLAVAIVIQASLNLADRHEAEGSWVGVGLLAASLTAMPALSLLKLRWAARTGLAVLAAEARETIACSLLSLTALVGLLANALLGLWWLDAVTALLLVPWLLREGLEGVRGDACFDGLRPCFCGTCFFGVRDCRPDGCVPACC
jgi:divalent metal cation (Fe/Co/Zn/Cd) transporter